MPAATLIRRRPTAPLPRRPAAADPATLRRLVEYAVRAPSAQDAQPWLFRIRGDALELRVDRTASTTDPGYRGRVIDCGAALAYLRVAIRALGRTAHVQRFPDAGDPDLLATIRLGEPCDATLDEVTLFAAIRRRGTHRRPFSERPVPERVLATLADTVRIEGAWLQVLSEPAERAAVAGDACTAPALLVLGTDDDSPAAWLRCGEALGLLLLRACVHGVAVSFIDPPVEVCALRTELARLPGGSRRQVVLGIGYGNGLPCLGGDDDVLMD
ncbi:MAG TPA: hypothetical protein VGX50_06320 [Longimicrobium sp.]|jgi:hypothetical protein|nr:hypothetical protein [Longimicrobium sp.]